MRSNSDDETLVESVATVEQANEPDKSKDLAHRLFSDTIIFCIAVVFVVVVTTLAVLLHNSSSSDTTTNTEQESEATPLPGPTTTGVQTFRFHSVERTVMQTEIARTA
jgi:flagellar basal body-associated protein FliL